MSTTKWKHAGMSWNYRVVREKTPDGWWYSVCSAYYNEKGEIGGHSVRGAEVSGESIEELHSCFEKFKRALEEPVLEWHEGEGYREVTDQTG